MKKNGGREGVRTLDPAKLLPFVVTLAIRVFDRFEGLPNTGPGKSGNSWHARQCVLFFVHLSNSEK
jgi:hypothetical protein